jgi:GntR family transcriptional regulator, rspAB operon transcriptional repressor
MTRKDVDATMTAASLEPVSTRPQSLTDIAFDRIRTAILTRKLEPGTRVSEAMLGEMLQVSKTPVREALLRLCYVGLVEPTTRGLRVVLPNSTIIRNAYEVRIGLETVAAQLAAGRATAEQRAGIIAAASSSLQCARAEDSEGFARWDREFHLSVAGASGNDLLAKAVEDSVTLAFTLRSRDVLTVDDSVRCGRHHVGISRTIKKGDGELASKQMQEHIISVTQFVLTAVS